MKSEAKTPETKAPGIIGYTDDKFLKVVEALVNIFWPVEAFHFSVAI